MGVRIARDSDGGVQITIAHGSQVNTALLTPVEARLLAIKLLLAAEDVDPQTEVGQSG